MTEQHLTENDLIAQRRAKLTELRQHGIAFPNDFKRDAYAADLHAEYGHFEKPHFEETKVRVKIAGRIMLQRVMGKASFVQLMDMTGRIQAYLRQNDLPEGIYEQSKKWDLGDIIGVEGFLFKTNTGELSVHAEKIVLLTKALHPLPDKFHGLSDKETRYRQRYVDLIANEESKKTLETRFKMIYAIREYFHKKRFLEVETPMMQTLAGGAAARPFVTHHNALDMTLFMRIAPELFLKRLVVGGFERVFEINRNFRNEGVSAQHNPEFTMIEFYMAYADYRDLIDLTEDLIRTVSQEVLGTTTVEYQGLTFDFSKPFDQMTMIEAILKYYPKATEAELNDFDQAKKIAEKLGITIKPTYGLGKIQTEIFEATAEDKLMQPTFITAYPAEISPLARKNDDNPLITDRFEFFMAGFEIANGFSELNDPEDQEERFHQQMKEKAAGDEEAMGYDEDYIHALEYGLPPTAGEGIGIDRLAMILTNSPSIRDVILFPLMRPSEK